MTTPPLCDEHEVLERLRLKAHQPDGLLNVGFIAPVACGDARPMVGLDPRSATWLHTAFDKTFWGDWEWNDSFLPSH